MPELGPAYLIHGDDHGAIAERRARLRALAEAQGDAAGVELLDGGEATPEGLARALCAMTFTIGRRVIVVDGVERWRQADVQQHVAPAFGALAPDTTVALFAREDARAKAPAALHEAVARAGGQVVAQRAVKPWELPRWVREQAARLGLALDAATASALVAQVGERQQRLVRELEKLALMLGAGGSNGDGSGAGAGTGGGNGAGDGAAMVTVTVEDVERAAPSSERRAYSLADALVGGDAAAAVACYVRLRAQGERLPGLTYVMASRLREALTVALRLEEGASQAELKRGLRMPAKAAERFLADVARTDAERLRAALATLADVELDTRGGAVLSAARDGRSQLAEDTVALRAIEAITA